MARYSGADLAAFATTWMCVLACMATERDACPTFTYVFVDVEAEGEGNGTSWQDAYVDLQDALMYAAPCSRILVAHGTYVPGPAAADTFVLANHVELYGGLAGIENPEALNLRLRDFGTHPTVLHGSYTAFHVVTARDVDDSAVLDGFTITGGCADGVTRLHQDVGGGVLCIDASPTIRRCLIWANSAGSKGGAVHNAGSAPTFVACRFVGNSSTVTQPGANVGGCIYNATSQRAASSPLLVNCLLVGNRAGAGSGGTGAAVYSEAGSRVTLVHCTLAGNRADTSVGGIYGPADIANSVLWNNSDASGTGPGAQLSGYMAVRYSCIQGGWPGDGNIGDDPLFVDPVGADGVVGTRDDLLALSPGSPVIDAGDNEALPEGITLDVMQRPRRIDDPDTVDTGVPEGDQIHVDMGAFEYQPACTSDEDCDDGDACTIDACDLDTHICQYGLLVCDDGVFCNGVEICVDGDCLRGQTPDCDDGFDCTTDGCDSETDTCIHIPDDASCDNGAYCDGTELCDVDLGCQSGAPVGCDDGVACTIDICDDIIDACTHVPHDAACDNGLYCDGREYCDLVEGCQLGAPPVCTDGIACTDDACDESADSCQFTPVDRACDDGLFCTGVETCEDTGCVSSGYPCGAGLVCDEERDACVGCMEHVDCFDGNTCTEDACLDGQCVYEEIEHCCLVVQDCAARSCFQAMCVAHECMYDQDETGTPCDDDLFCNGAETCADGICGPGDEPCMPEQTCNETTDTCMAPPQPCTTAQDCDDGNTCTDDTCDVDVCSHVYNDAHCDDGDACTNVDVCMSGICSGTPIPGCGDVTPEPGGGGGSSSPAETSPPDDCPDDPDKTVPGICGCGVADVDSDEDGTPDCLDDCPEDVAKIQPGACGCGQADADWDEDGVADCHDGCAQDPAKSEPGICGCGISDGDQDEDGTPDCHDGCPASASKTAPGACGCLIEDVDGDGDQTPDCLDACPHDGAKIDTGVCGCGVADMDSDSDGVADCLDLCPTAGGNPTVDGDGCPMDPPAPSPVEVDNELGDDLSDNNNAPTDAQWCGACGAIGLPNAILILMGLAALRLLPRRS